MAVGKEPHCARRGKIQAHVFRRTLSLCDVPMSSAHSHPARLAAIAAGEIKFTTGEPCAMGHTSARYVSNAACVACTAIRTKANAKREREEHRAFVARCLSKKAC